MDFIERYSYNKNKHPAHRKIGREQNILQDLTILTILQIPPFKV